MLACSTNSTIHLVINYLWVTHLKSCVVSRGRLPCNIFHRLFFYMLFKTKMPSGDPLTRKSACNIIQICHASVGNMTECFPEGGWFSPRAEPEGKPSSRGETFHHVTHTGMAYLIYYTEQTQFAIVNKARSQMTGDSHIPR